MGGHAEAPDREAAGVTRRRALQIAAGAAATQAFGAPALGATGKAHDIVLIVADDLGFSDLGAFGGEIATPNLDRLAKAGLRLSNFHAAAGCSPTRAMLMAGIDHHRAGFGAFAETVQDNQRGHPGYEGYLVERAACIADQLQKAGYRTMMSGKWHLGVDRRADPSVRGFRRSFALMGGASNFFGLHAAGMPGGKGEYREDGKPVTSLPADFYSTDYFTSRLIQFLGEDAGSRDPVFAYLAFTAPHFPIQALPSDIRKYRGRYDAGWGALRRARLRGMVRQGLLSREPEADRVDEALAASWNALGPDAKQIAARKMEVYAAAVDRMDQNVGRLVDALKQSGRLENTLFFFMSDNGAEGTQFEDTNSGEVYRATLSQADNRLENLGAATSYFWYGPGWGQAATAPFRMFKHHPTEGGVRVPAFVTLPGAIPAGGVSDAYAFVTDVAPTFLEVASAPAPDPVAAHPYTGASMFPFATGRARQVHAEPETGWELWGRRAYRKGRWKAVLIPPPAGSGAWELYDMVADPSEQVNLAQREPDRLNALAQAWERYARENGVVLPAVPGV